MNYMLSITKTVPNDNYEEELKQYNKYSTLNRPYALDTPQKSFSISAMSVELTEKQFEAVKSAALKEFV